MTEGFKESEIGFIPEDWEISTIGKQIGLLTDYHANGSYKKLKENVALKDKSDYAVMIRTTNFEQNDFESNLKYINKHAYEFLSKSKVFPDDILMNKIANAGSVYIMPNLKKPVSLAMNLFLLRMKKTVNQRFVFYYLKNFEKYIKNFCDGSVTKTITKNNVRKLPLILPPITEQESIAQILTNLDQKIELNNQMNQTLESIGQAIFKHWFVDFEFPDSGGNPYKSNGGEMVDSELGEIPKGWKIGTISDLCSSITNGGTPKRNIESYWNNGEIPWYKTGELSDNPLLDSEEHINQNGLENSSCKLWEPNTILIALYASPTVGRLGILKTNATSNQACSGLIAKNDVGYQYLFYTLLFKRNELNSIAVGSAQQNISQDIIKNTKALIPTSKNTKKFQELLEPLFEMRTLLLNEANNLSKIRDSLLPKLMSGKIRVNISEEAL